MGDFAETSETYTNEDGDELTIRGARRIQQEEQAGHARRAQKHVRRFARRIQIPRDIRPVGFEASFKQGLLDIALLKRQRGPKV